MYEATLLLNFTSTVFLGHTAREAVQKAAIHHRLHGGAAMWDIKLRNLKGSPRMRVKEEWLKMPHLPAARTPEFEAGVVRLLKAVGLHEEAACYDNRG